MKEDTGYVTLKAGGTITEHAALKIDSNGDAVVTSTANDRPIGHAIRAAATGEPVTIKVGAGKFEAIAAAAIARGALVYGTTSGNMTSTAGTQAPSGMCSKAAAGAAAKFEYISLV